LDTNIAVNILRRRALEVQVNPFAGDEFKGVPTLSGNRQAWRPEPGQRFAGCGSFSRPTTKVVTVTTTFAHRTKLQHKRFEYDDS
jgi:hypothetical protein